MLESAAERTGDWRNIEERVVACAEYIVKTGCTVRTCAFVLGSSKSTVHTVVTN